MGSDAAAMAIASAPASSKDMGKKKRANRSAKLKQCKLDARREQWLSQVKNKGCKVTGERHHAPSPPSQSPPPRRPLAPLPRVGKPDAPLVANPGTRSRGDENDGSVGLHDSDLDSPVNSPTSSASGNNSSQKDCPTNSISSGPFSRSVSDDDEEDEEDEGAEGEGGGEGTLDDWEAVADALTAENHHHRRHHHHQFHPSSEPNVLVPTVSLESRKGDGILRKPEPNRTIPRAWRPDDAFRPQSLPNLSKQRSFPVNLERYCSHGTMAWEHHCLVSQPTACPICYEDLDPTDTSFLPCACGFRLCLFCHKRILEADGRCPGCRKQYGPVVGGEMGISAGHVPQSPMRLSRSCSMSSSS